MKLYFMPRTRSVRSRWLLEELEVPYELVKLDAAKLENKEPAYLAINPLGEAPALVDGETTLFESSAICLYLADRFADKQLAPPPGSSERGQYYQWIAFAEGTVEPVVRELYRYAQLPEGQKASAPVQEVIAGLRARLRVLLDVIDARLGDREFLVAGQFTVADIIMASLLHMAHTLTLLEGHPRLHDYCVRQTKRPASRRAVTL